MRGRWLKKPGACRSSLNKLDNSIREPYWQEERKESKNTRKRNQGNGQSDADYANQQHYPTQRKCTTKGFTGHRIQPRIVCGTLCQRSTQARHTGDGSLVMNSSDNRDDCKCICHDGCFQQLQPTALARADLNEESARHSLDLRTVLIHVEGKFFFSHKARLPRSR